MSWGLARKARTQEPSIKYSLTFAVHQFHLLLQHLPFYQYLLHSKDVGHGDNGDL